MRTPAQLFPWFSLSFVDCILTQKIKLHFIGSLHADLGAVCTALSGGMFR